jgi:nicotinate-nucleotide adenylyltransferase
MNLALFGGTFDPVHRGHLAAARAAAKQFDLQTVYFVPATLPPHKGNRDIADFHHRFAMLALATADEDRFLPSLMEAIAGRPNYSIHTVRQLKNTLKESDKLYFLIGIDAFMDIGSWKDSVQLLGECDFIVVSRPGYSLADVGQALPEALRPPAPVLQRLRRATAGGSVLLPSTTIHLLSGVRERVSSTQIRAAASKSVRQLGRYVPATVATYIRKERLYISASADKEKTAAGQGKVLSFRRANHRES